MAKRSPILGYNHNFRHRGMIFHVQTEDSGVANPHIFTHLFHGGVILQSRKLDYDREAAEETVKALMQAQHRAVLKDLKRGTFDAKIEQYFGDHPDLLPPERDAAALIAEAEAAEKGAPDAGSGPDAEPSAEPSAVPTRPRRHSDVSGAFDALVDPGETDEDDVAEIHSPAPPPAPQPPGARPHGVGEYAQHRRPERREPALPAAVPSARTAAGSIPPRPPGRAPVPPPAAARPTPPATGRPAASPPSARGGARAGGSGVVVSRPAVIVGAPPRVVGAGSAPAPTNRTRTARLDSKPDGLFGQDLISEKSLDEVILAYLSEDPADEG